MSTDVEVHAGPPLPSLSLKRGRGSGSTMARGGSGRKASSDVDDDALRALYKQYLTKATSVVYATDPNEPVNTARITQHAAFLKAIYKFGASLRKKDLIRTLAAHAYKMEETWLLAGEQIRWAEVMAKRIQTMMRHIATNCRAAMSKGNDPPGWAKPFVKFLPESDNTETAEESQAAEAEAPAKVKPRKGKSGATRADQADNIASSSSSRPCYTYGYHEEMGCWRKPMSKPNSKPEYAVTVYAPDGKSDHQDAVAEWADGHCWNCDAVTCGELRARQNAKAAGGGRGTVPVHWEGVCSRTKAAVKVKDVKRGEQRFVVISSHHVSPPYQVVQITTADDESRNLFCELARQYCAGVPKAELEQQKREFIVAAKAKAKVKAKADQAGNMRAPGTSEKQAGQAKPAAAGEHAELATTATQVTRKRPASSEANKLADKDAKTAKRGNVTDDDCEPPQRKSAAVEDSDDFASESDSNASDSDDTSSDSEHDGQPLVTPEEL
eukprot:TRINITY_DN41553_c0_g1_i2.p1 TRINITY_DN41553_c0_g1~~TRINITY_DN41553_c0_g1_i2.p1  ORF type:complete len:496 (+),score=120.02 TRINITY_DN41553_c0_g1_i2:51-1538(+)